MGDMWPEWIKQMFSNQFLGNNQSETFKSPKGNVYILANSTPVGQGGYGQVMMVREQRTQQHYAMKKMSKQLVQQVNAMSNIQQEIQIHSGLDHPNIVRLIEHFENQQWIIIIMELCEGGNLQKLKKPLSEKQAFNYFNQMMLGLSYMHSKGIVHRDIKPENILITRNDVIKICDFNWASYVKNGQRLQATLCGTTEYMPPEVILNVPHGLKVDIWSAGLVLYEMLHGVQPFRGKTQQDKIFNVLNTQKLMWKKDISYDAQYLILKMLSRVENNRPSCQEVFQMEWMTRLYNESQMLQSFPQRPQSAIQKFQPRPQSATYQQPTIRPTVDKNSRLLYMGSYPPQQPEQRGLSSQQHQQSTPMQTQSLQTQFSDQKKSSIRYDNQVNARFSSPQVFGQPSLVSPVRGNFMVSNYKQLQSSAFKPTLSHGFYPHY